MVWRARHATTGAPAAVKEINTDKLNKKLQESLASEVAVLSQTKHRNIVGLLDLLKVRTRAWPGARVALAAPAAPRVRALITHRRWVCAAPRMHVRAPHGPRPLQYALAAVASPATLGAVGRSPHHRVTRAARPPTHAPISNPHAAKHLLCATLRTTGRQPHLHRARVLRRRRPGAVHPALRTRVRVNGALLSGAAGRGPQGAAAAQRHPRKLRRRLWWWQSSGVWRSRGLAPAGILIAVHACPRSQRGVYTDLPLSRPSGPPQRDLKPQNLLLSDTSATPLVKIADVRCWAAG